MIRILFVCHGNICRSPMAEFVMKDLVKKAGLEARFHIESAATTAEEIGNPVYPPVARLLAKHGISCAGKTARRMTRADCDRYDLLIGMDQENLRDMGRIASEPGAALQTDPDGPSRGDASGKISLLMDYTARPGSVADPWYTRDFEATWRDVNEGCRGLLAALERSL